MRNKYMAWKQLEYSKNQVDKAGKKVLTENTISDDYKEALKIVDNWRSVHGYPLYVISNKLKRMTNGNKSFVVHRLKRIDSIIAKLKRNEHMSLRNMQDIGGCRVVVPKIEDVYRIANDYEKSRIRHEFVKENDYIQNPKRDGYRCLHRVYKYVSDDKNSPYNGMKIEIQFRTLLQHYWATAVETMGLCTNTNLKAGVGDEGHKKFFSLVSSLFAMVENTPLVPDITNDPKELLLEIKNLNERYHIINKLNAISTTVVMPPKMNRNIGYYLLNLDLETFKLSIAGFRSKDFKIAAEEYDRLENLYGEKHDIVLVSSSSMNELKKAYPNYFGDIKAFIEMFGKLFDIVDKVAQGKCITQ